MAGDKHDEGKIRFDLLPDDALTLIAEVLTQGASEYGDHNWEEGISASRLESAARRHMTRWKLGQTKDPKSKLSHLVHAACDLLMMVALENRAEPGFDDRRFIFTRGATFQKLMEVPDDSRV